MNQANFSTPTQPDQAPVDFSDKGRRDGVTIRLDRRVFMKFTAFTNCPNPAETIEQLKDAGVVGALYLDASDHRGIGVMAANEDPDYFVTTLRDIFSQPAFARLVHKPEFDMFGRTYSIGYEADLQETLLDRPLRKLQDPRLQWSVWYPLQRAKPFETLPAEDRKRMLHEHGTLARQLSAGGEVTDIRLACHGLDRNDNDFIVGLVGPKLHPLSAVVQAMRSTEQTSKYVADMGPFFVGKVAWQSAT